MPYPYSYDDEEKSRPPQKLPTNRNVWKLVILSILTLGLYSIFFFIPFSFDLDKIAPKSDHSKTTNYLVAYIVSLFTLNIVMLLWMSQINERVEEALQRREIAYEMKQETFWGWYFFGSFILVGPIVYFYKLCKAMNLLCADYNARPNLEDGVTA